MESDEDNSIFPRVSSKTPSRLRDSFNALNSSRLAYKELENCRASAAKREIEGMRSPVFGLTHLVNKRMSRVLRPQIGFSAHGLRD